MRRLIPLLLLSACYGQEAWVDTVGNTWCAREKQCYPTDFDANYTNTADCKTEWRDLWGEFDACLAEAGCTYDAKGAAECHKELKQASCEEVGTGAWSDVCGSQVYSCTIAQSVDAGFCAFGF